MAFAQEMAGRDGQLASLAGDYQRPDLKITLEQIRRARLRLRLAMSAQSAAHAVEELLSCWQNYAQSRNLAGLIHEQKASNTNFTQEMLFFAASDGPVQLSLAQALKAIDDCRFRDEVLAKGPPFDLAAARAWADLANERVQSECELEITQVLEIKDWLAQSRVFCLGQRWPVAALPALLESPQRSIRRATCRGILDFIKNHEDWLNRQAQDLLDIRSQIVKKLHLANFNTYANLRTGLACASDDRFSSFKQYVQHYFVPIGVEIRRLQRKRLNLEHLSEHDWLCLLPDGHPVPAISRDTQLTAITASLTGLLQRHAPELAIDFSVLERPRLDFQLGPDMYGASRASLLGPKGPVYWRLPHHGTMMDISHHLHAYGPLLATLADQAAALQAGWTRAPELPDLARTTLQACLTEQVAQPLLSDLILENDLFSLLRLTQKAEALVFLTMQADYSQRLHQDPLLDPAQRQALWLLLEQTYLPDLVHGEWPYLSDGGLAHLALVAWLEPGQTLAQAWGLFAALAIWQQNRTQPEKLSQIWARLISQGQHLTFGQLLENFQIPAPWDEDSFKRLAFAVSAELSL